MAKNNLWKVYEVRYWDCDPTINRCFGNSHIRFVKARSPIEAEKKTEEINLKNHGGRFAFFKLGTVKVVE